MSGVAPGWYKDPADPATQRYWDGDGWVGHALPAEVEPPPGPPPAEEPSVPPVVVTAPAGEPLAPLAPPAAPASPTSPTSPTSPAPAAPVASVPVSTPTGPLDGPATGPPIGPPPPGSPYQAYRYPLPLPPPRPHGLVLATPGARLVARLIDIIALALLNLLVNGWFIWQLYVEVAPSLPDWAAYLSMQTREVPQDSPRAGWLRIVIILITAALWLAYEVPAVANTGQTFGKRVLGIQVVRVEAPGPVGFARSLRRWNTLGLPTLLWTCCGIGFVLQFVDAVYLLADRPLQQALHDKSARTVVVRVASAPPAPAGTPAGQAHTRPGNHDEGGSA